MIRLLVFTPRGVRSGGKFVCNAHFESRTQIDRMRVCTVAASARDRLAQHLAAAPLVEVFDPLIPEQAAWSTLFQDAAVFELHADLPACLIVRHADARRFVAAAFGETPAAMCGALSPIEARVMDRLLREIALALEPLVGPMRRAPNAVAAPRAHRCYFEMRFGPPIDATVGVALEEPPSPTTGALAPQILADVELECTAEIPIGMRPAKELAGLSVGSIVRFNTKGGHPAALKVDAQTIAMGECGSHGESAAFLIRTLSLIGVFP